jgi:hypothetical protein
MNANRRSGVRRDSLAKLPMPALNELAVMADGVLPDQLTGYPR